MEQRNDLWSIGATELIFYKQLTKEHKVLEHRKENAVLGRRGGPLSAAFEVGFCSDQRLHIQSLNKA